MAKAILLTGAPGSGKTTLIRKIVSRLPHAAGGFYTEEVRSKGVRQGFNLVTLDGGAGLLAHVDLDTSQRVGKYGVDLTTLERLGVAAIHAAIARGAVVVIDEIGPMELLSAAFRQAVRDALDSRSPVLATMVQRPTPFTAELRARTDVAVLELRPANRDQLRERVLILLGLTGR